MYFLKNMRRYQKHKDKGITLVEVIISLLILMIIFVPLISSFLTSSKITVNVRKNMYASNLASNVMETSKLLGIEGVASQFYGASANFIVAQGISLLYNEDLTGITEADKSIKVDGEGINYFNSSRKTTPYVYQMTGVQEGTGTFDVTVTFSSASYTSAPSLTPAATPALTPAPAPAVLPNDYKYADLSAFNSESTALINPKISGTNYDYLAKTYFRQLHDSYYYDEWVSACEIVNNANNSIYLAYEQACDAAIAAGNPLPPMPAVTPIPIEKATLNEADLNDRITKITNIEISEVTDILTGIKKYNLNSYITYSFNNILNNGGTIEGLCADPSSTVLERKYAGYCDDVKSTKLDSIFLMYTPFVSVTDWTNEKVSINNLVSQKFNIYLVVQAAANTTFPSSSQLPVELSGTTNLLNLYSQATLSVSGTGSASTSNATAEADRLLTELGSDKGRIYDVTIKVYESGTSFTKLLQTLSSTVVSK